MTIDGADPGGLESRLRSTRAGVALSVFCGLYLAGYCLLTWSQPHRGAILAIAAGAVAGSLAMPVRALLLHARREAFLLAWSAVLIALITLVTLLDDGVSSPLAAFYFLPPVFSALSYPARSMAAVAIADIAAYVAAAIAGGGASPAQIGFVALTLSAAGWMCAWQARNHERQQRALARVSRADPLTGALNRRGFDERFAAELDRARRAGDALGLVLVDLDHFKRTNDRLGHAAGDEQLRWAVRAMVAALRPSDHVGRLGGDEFAVLLPGAATVETDALAARLRAALAEGAPASLGVASFPADGLDAVALHQVADLDLYATKQARATGRPTAGAGALSWASALARAVDERMALRHEHSLSVARYAVLIGERLGLGDDDLAALRLAAVLHDVGKLAVPEAVLRKPEPLTEAERRLVERHPAAGAEMVARIDGLESIAPWVRASQEHVDGSGYPVGLAGEEIPLEARILLVADAFDAMTSERPYSPAIPVDDALAELRRCAGRQFDPACVELLCEALAPERAAA